MFQSLATALISMHLIWSTVAVCRREKKKKITGEISGYRVDQIKLLPSFFFFFTSNCCYMFLCHEHMTESVWVTVCRWLMLVRLGIGEGE